MAALSKKRRSEIAKKAARTRKRNTRSTPVRRATARKTRRRSPRKKGLLAEAFSPAVATQSAKATLQGIGGGLAIALLEKVTGGMNANNTLMVQVGATFLTAAVLKRPELAAGMGGAIGYKLASTFGLADGGYLEDTGYTEYLEEMPQVLDTYGNPVTLAEGYQVPYAPQFGGF